MKKKVFCIDCKYYVNGRPYIRGGFCDAPENQRDDWEKPNALLMEDPKKINKHNNCKYYKPKPKKNKWQKFWDKIIFGGDNK